MNTLFGHVHDTHKVLSVRQPYAWLIVNGIKPIENRSWYTNYRGTLLIHAGKSTSEISNIPAIEDARHVKIAQTDFDFGAIIGSVELVDVVSQSKSRWFDGPYGFVLRNAKVLTPFAVRGRERMFDYVGALAA